MLSPAGVHGRLRAVSRSEAWRIHPPGAASAGDRDQLTDGRIIDGNDAPYDGAVMLNDTSATSAHRAFAVVFIGATGNIRMFDRPE